MIEQLSTTALEYRDDLVAAYWIATQLRRTPIEPMLSAIALAEAAAPILYPTEFREHGPRMQQDKRVLEILVDAQRALNRLPWPELAR
jgi:hypothetical protein